MPKRCPHGATCVCPPPLFASIAQRLIPPPSEAAPPQIVTAGLLTGTPVIFAGGNITAEGSQRVLMQFVINRTNTAANGVGGYQFTVDGQGVGPVFVTSGGLAPFLVSGLFLAILSAGTHSLGVQVFAQNGDEIIGEGSFVVQGRSVF